MSCWKTIRLSTPRQQRLTIIPILILPARPAQTEAHPVCTEMTPLSPARIRHRLQPQSRSRMTFMTSTIMMILMISITTTKMTSTAMRMLRIIMMRRGMSNHISSYQRRYSSFYKISPFFICLRTFFSGFPHSFHHKNSNIPFELRSRCNGRVP